MSDKKMSNTRKYRIPARRRNPEATKFTTAWIHKAPTDSCQLMSSWDAGLLTAQTTGVISTTRAPSFTSFATEYSAVSTLFGEVKLVRAVLVISPINPRNTTVIHGKINVGWNPIQNATTFANPTSFSQVVNLAGWKTITTAWQSATEVAAYTNNHLWQRITNADPEADTGDCGAWIIYSDVLTPSDNYFSCQVHAHYVFKGRL